MALGSKVPCALGWLATDGTWLHCDNFIWCVSCTVVVLTCFVTCGQGRIKLFGAPRQWKNFRPLFQAVFLSGGGGYYPPDWVKHHASQSKDRNNKYFILYIEFVAPELFSRLTRMRHAWKGDCYLTVLVFHGRYFYSLKFTNERKRNANTYLISNFDSLEAAPSNPPP